MLPRMLRLRWAGCASALATLLMLPALALAGAPAPAAPASAPQAVQVWILHFDGESAEAGREAYQGLLRQVPGTVPVIVAVKDRSDEALFRQSVDLPLERWDTISFLRTARSLSNWARDRYLILQRGGRPTIVLPDPETVHGDRLGDLDVAARLAAGWLPLRLMSTRLDFEGGDLLVGRRVALIGGRTVIANARRLGLETREIEREFAHVLGRRVLVVEEPELALPHDHLDMYVHLVDDRLALVGDPRAALAIWGRVRASPGEWSRLAELGPAHRGDQVAVAASYDAVAQQLREKGFEVRRVPAVHARGSDILLTWTNAVTEIRDGVRLAYVPSYGLPRLDAEAHGAWRKLGFEVRPVPAGLAIQEGGAVRCLTNVVCGPPALLSGPEGARDNRRIERSTTATSPH